MFVIDRKKNRMSEIPGRTFKELEIKEREDLQEWLANTPGALGEELLIVQKEFAGFEETRHRLDLLALDKSGSLVIIENKLDDSGRDVVAQALKYVAYCSSLKKSQIIEIFQDYLTQQKRADKSASALICDFLEKDTIEEVNLNSGSSQRFILVAAKFGKDVTSTILWLISNGIKGQCMTVTLYDFHDGDDVSNNKLFLDINQIIPPPEAKDYIIGMSSKDKDEQDTKTVLLESVRLRLEFWKQALDFFREQKVELYSNVSPSRDHWLNTGSGKGGCVYTMIFGKQEARVEFNIARASKEENKHIFDFLFDHKQDIENRFKTDLLWQRLDDKKVSRIRFSKDFDGYNKDNWSDIIQWLFVHIQKLEKSVKPLISEIPQKLSDGSPLDDDIPIDGDD